MSKFKVGDVVKKVRGSYAGYEMEITHFLSNGSPEGKITKTGNNPEFRVGGCGGDFEEYYELVTPLSELEQLVEAVAVLLNKHRGQFNRTGDRIYDEVVYFDEDADTIRMRGKLLEVKVKEPYFEPFTVGENWTVKLHAKKLCIGCKSFNPESLKSNLKSLVNDNVSNTSSFGDAAFFSTRKGVSYEGYSVTWTEAEKILVALEKAGV